MSNAKNIAKYIISKFQSVVTNEIEGDLTNLKLQKLLYYVQMLSIEKLGKPAFSNTIEAWKYGPVIPDVYHEYSTHGKNVITIEKPTFSLDSEGLKVIVDQVVKDKGKYTGIALMEISHDEQSWISAYNAENKIITNDAIKASL